MSTDDTPRFAYAARSAAEDDDRTSTISQLEAIRARVDVAAEFSESGFSGSKRNRGPQLQAAIDAAIAAAREHGHAELWAFHSSRFGRGSGKLGEARALGGLFYDLRAKGVALRTVEDDEFVTNEQLIGIASSQAAKYAADLSAHTRRGLAARKGKGAPVGAVPFGYRSEPAIVNGEVVTSRIVDETNAAIVVDVFQQVASGATPGAVARSLNARGVSTQRGNVWRARSVSHLISNDVYAGGGAYPSIIDQELSKQAQALLKRLDPVALQARKGGRPPRDEHAFLLRGLAFCRCGATMNAVTGRYTVGGERLHYVCSERLDCTGTCDLPPIPRDLAEAEITSHLHEFVGSITDWLAARDGERDDERAQHDAAVERERAALADVERKVARAQDRYDAVLDDDALADAALRQVARIEQARDEQARRVADTEAVASEWTADPATSQALDFANHLIALFGEAAVVPALLAENVDPAIRANVARALRDTLASVKLWTSDGMLRADFHLRVESETSHLMHVNGHVSLPSLAVAVAA